MQEGYEKFVIKNPEGCWDWKGCCPENPGYGQFRSGLKRERAHRASWMIHYGPIPDGMFVCHKCDNKRCSRPDHLFLATCKENNLDMIAKDRHPTLARKGEANIRAKLKDEQVAEIKNLIESGISQYKIAKRFDVSQATISNINLNKVWR